MVDAADPRAPEIILTQSVGCVTGFERSDGRALLARGYDGLQQLQF